MADKRRSKVKKAGAPREAAKTSASRSRRAAPEAAPKAKAVPRARGAKAPAARTPGKKASTSASAAAKTAAKAAGAPRKRPAAPRRSPKKPSAATAILPVASGGWSLGEEARIESAKYAARPPRRAFEEERFIFPETYGLNRVRLLVKDPEWLFAHWDVSPDTLAGLGAELGARAVELSKLTLRVFDAGSGGSSVILLPAGVRSWYVRADSRRRAYRAELGLTLPSGEFRLLAESNTVVTPRVGPSRERASRVLHYRQGRKIPRGAGRVAAEEDVRSVSGKGPWSPVPDRAAPHGPGDWVGSSSRSGGASESFHPGGASDVHRR